MITGKVPFKGDYESAIIYSIMNDIQEPATSLRTGIPMELERIINKCLQKNPSDRYQHVDELIVDLRVLKRESDSKITLTKRPVSKKRTKYIFLSAAIVLMAILFIAGYLLFFQPDKQEKTGMSQWENSIAVLPLTDLSPEKDQEYFCDGMTEQLITNLTKLGKLKVIARTSVMKFKQTDKTIPEIGKELDVSHVLEGSIRKYKNKIRITTQLIKTEDGSHLWADDFDRELEDIFEIQDGISEKISNILLQSFPSNGSEQDKSKNPKNIEAYEHYFKAKYYSTKYYHTSKIEYFKISEKQFKKAITLDPSHALSYSGLANLYNTHHDKIRFPKNVSEQELNNYMDLQEKYINIAYNLEPTSSDVNIIMGWVYWAKDKMDSCYMFVKKAYLSKPNDYHTNMAIAACLVQFGLSDRAIDFYNRCVLLDPLAPSLYEARGLAYNILGNFGQAEIDYKRALELEPHHDVVLRSYTMLLFKTKRYDEAIKMCLKYEALKPNCERSKMFKALRYAAAGEKEKALDIDLDPGHKPVLYLFLEKHEETLQNLESVTNEVESMTISLYLIFKNNPQYDFLRSDSRFQEILARHRKIYEENLRKYGNIDSRLLKR